MLNPSAPLVREPGGTALSLSVCVCWAPLRIAGLVGNEGEQANTSAEEEPRLQRSHGPGAKPPTLAGQKVEKIQSPEKMKQLGVEPLEELSHSLHG